MSKQYSNQAEIYNKVKAIAFSIYNRDGYSAALKCVEKLSCPSSIAIWIRCS